MKWNDKWIFPIALLAMGIPMWAMPYTEVKSLHTFLLILVGVVAFLHALFTHVAPWKVALTTTLCLLLALVIRFLIDWVGRTNEHHLWSLVLVFALFGAIVLSFAGAYLGYLARRVFRT